MCFCAFQLGTKHTNAIRLFCCLRNLLDETEHFLPMELWIGVTLRLPAILDQL